MQEFDVTTIILVALAVLGQKTGHERPPFNPFSRREPPVRPGTIADSDNVVRLPGAAAERAPAAAVEPMVDRWKGVAEPDTPVARGLDAIVKQEPGFDA